MYSEQYLTQAEVLEIETAKLDTHEKFLTRITVSSLRLLQEIAKDEGVEVAQLTPAQIIAWFERDAEAKRNQGDRAGKLQW
jgi:hypothetical protein